MYIHVVNFDLNLAQEKEKEGREEVVALKTMY